MTNADIVTNALSGMGPAGAAIAVLMGTIGALATAVVWLFRANGRLHVERRAESGALIKVIESNNSALNKNSAATEERNKITAELADAIAKLAAAFELVTQRVDFHHEDNKEKLKDLIQSFTSVADAIRGNTAVVSDVRNGHASVLTVVNAMAAKVDAAFARRTR
jgi:molecular chaperone GrpE (heat shock protein)